MHWKFYFTLYAEIAFGHKQLLSCEQKFFMYSSWLHMLISLISSIIHSCTFQYMYEDK